MFDCPCNCIGALGRELLAAASAFAAVYSTNAGSPDPLTVFFIIRVRRGLWSLATLVMVVT
jgi:hypothetical protein